MLFTFAVSASAFLLAPTPPRAAQRMGAVSMSAADALGRRTAVGLGLATGAVTASTLATPAANAANGNTVTFQVALSADDVKGVPRRARCLERRLTHRSRTPLSAQMS